MASRDAAGSLRHQAARAQEALDHQPAVSHGGLAGSNRSVRTRELLEEREFGRTMSTRSQRPIQNRRAAVSLWKSTFPLANCEESLPLQDAASSDRQKPWLFGASRSWKKATEGVFHGHFDDLNLEQDREGEAGLEGARAALLERERNLVSCSGEPGRLDGVFCPGGANPADGSAFPKSPNVARVSLDLPTADLVAAFASLLVCDPKQAVDKQAAAPQR